MLPGSDSKKSEIFVKGILSFPEEIDVPWRKEKNPLKVLVGELLLIRTKVKQAARVYNEFFKVFPDGIIPERQKNLAFEILKKAGLSHRARGIIRLLEKLEKESTFPNDPAILRKFPYVSDYIISALGYFIYGKDVPLIDSNVIRLLNRYFGQTVGDGRHPTQFHKRIMEYLVALAGSKKRDFILKTLDFSILVCAPKPRCKRCPFITICDIQRKIDP